MTQPQSGQQQLVDQPSKAPTRKWIAGGATGQAAVVLVWIAAEVGVDLPPAVAAEIVLIAGLAAAWLKRNAPALVDCLDDEPGQHAADR